MGGEGRDAMHYYWWDSGWGWWGMFIMMVVFWGAILAAVIYGIRALTHRNAPTTGPPAESPLDILKKRYARGEIDRQEYEDKKRDLS